jgi:radical SAM-linked protein
MMTDGTPTKQRLIITFGKFAALRYTSNLDIAKIWERVLRRADLPLLYSQGFNTRPRIQLASALPLGITSECELIDVSLKEIIPLDGLPQRLEAVSPDGLRVFNVQETPAHSPALQALVRSAEYRISFLDRINPALLQDRVRALLDRPSIVRTFERKNRKSAVDLRLLIHDLRIEGDSLIAHLASGEKGNFRPDDLLRELELYDFPHIIHRFRLYLLESR